MPDFKVGDRVAWHKDLGGLFLRELVLKYGHGPFEVAAVDLNDLGPARCSCGAIRRMSQSGCCLPQYLDHELSCAMYQTPANKIIINTTSGPQEFSADLFDLCLEV